MNSNELSQRTAVVAEARSWLSTKYHEQGDIKGVGVDCGMLLVRVFVDLHLVETFDPRPYARDWMMHNGEEKYLGWINDNCGEIQEADARPGDIVVFRFGRTYSHGGIITAAAPRLALVHAYADAGYVVEETFRQNGALTSPHRKPRFFSLWAKRGA